MINKISEHKFLKQILTLFALLWVAAGQAVAQGREIEMADRLREDGKIWVVVGVVLLIFAGIVIYLVWLDRKITRIEKQIK